MNTVNQPLAYVPRWQSGALILADVQVAVPTPTIADDGLIYTDYRHCFEVDNDDARLTIMARFGVAIIPPTGAISYQSHVKAPS